jgi:hypothetical protein
LYVCIYILKKITLKARLDWKQQGILESYGDLLFKNARFYFLYHQKVALYLLPFKFLQGQNSLVHTLIAISSE